MLIDVDIVACLATCPSICLLRLPFPQPRSFISLTSTLSIPIAPVSSAISTTDRIRLGRPPSTTLGPLFVHLHHLRLRGSRSTAAEMPSVLYDSLQCPLTSFLFKTSIPPCLHLPPLVRHQTSGSPAGTPTQGLAGVAGTAGSPIAVRHLREDCHTRQPSAVLLWHYFTCYQTPAA